MGLLQNAVDAVIKQGLSINWGFRFWGIKPMNKWRFFTDEESKNIEPELMAKLDMARSYAKIPFVITCGLRDVQQNIDAGGVADSAHLPDKNGLSQAVDIACVDSLDRWKMVFALKDAGFTRIVIEQKHIHVDIDATKPQYVLPILDKP